MDKLLRKIGLSGRSIVPMLVGFGCTVPGVMANGTLPSERDRKMTILLTPYMSCSAKLPIYLFFTAAFFPEHGALVMIALYFGGIAVGILSAIVMRKLKFKGRSSAICHGAAQLSYAWSEECRTASVGKRQKTSYKGHLRSFSLQLLLSGSYRPLIPD